LSNLESPSIDSQIEFYNKYWNDLESFSAYKIFRIERILGHLVQIRKLLGDELTILDLGCGDGRSVAIWSILGNATGIDLSTRAMEKARKLFPHLKFSSGDATKTTFEPASFNVIISQEVLEHIEDQRAYIEECYRLLLPGGYLILTTPNKFYFDRLRGGNYSQQPIEKILTADELRLLVIEFFDIQEFQSIIAATGHYGIYRILSNRLVVGVCRKMGLEFVRIRLMEKYRLGVHLILVARKR